MLNWYQELSNPLQNPTLGPLFQAGASGIEIGRRALEYHAQRKQNLLAAAFLAANEVANPAYQLLDSTDLAIKAPNDREAGRRGFTAVLSAMSVTLILDGIRTGFAGEPLAVPDGAPEPVAAPPELPPFDGKTTKGVFVRADGSTVPLESAGGDPAYRGYVASGHVEGKAALDMRSSGAPSGTVYHNNPNGTCGYCNLQLPTLLPEGAELTVVPPPNAVANNSRAVAVPKTYTGNAKVPKTR